ncbi:interleukin-17F-like [Perca fluviatilis]|uniref:interleukin-17F-like n=1 Tax=Perca fluviatilis TaxID=8168 RepID=UPI001965DBBD|nr:interleukin-17F-like [Perca fluviatilis]
MTRWVSLHMISLGSLLFLNGHCPSAAAGGRSRCFSEDQLKKRADRFERRYWGTLSHNLQGARTCAGAAAEMRGDVNGRSLSPWNYSITREDDRFPHEIAVAECLHEGCIINGSVNKDYNSVPVIAKLMILKKTPCKWDATKYMVEKGIQKIAVGCTCVVPKSLN